MERINLRKYEGFESVDSSVLQSVYGGAGWGQLIKTLLELIDVFIIYKEDYWEGFKEGFGMI